MENWEPFGKVRYTGGGIEAMLRLKKETFPNVRWEDAPEATFAGAARLAWEAAESGGGRADPFAHEAPS